MKRGVIYRDRQPIVPMVWYANRPWSRLRGLLARPPLRDEAREALWLVPCGSIHTFGMTYPLDLVFLDRTGCVIDWAERVAPWRVRVSPHAHQTVELAAGGLATLSPKIGEQWQWRPA